MLTVEKAWLCLEPLDMRTGADKILSRVVQAFGQAKPNHAYIFANKRANRMKVLVIDSTGIWLSARRLYSGKFQWSQLAGSDSLALDDRQLQALIAGLPWQYAGREFSITAA